MYCGYIDAQHHGSSKHCSNRPKCYAIQVITICVATFSLFYQFQSHCIAQVAKNTFARFVSNMTLQLLLMYIKPAAHHRLFVWQRLQPTSHKQGLVYHLTQTRVQLLAGPAWLTESKWGATNSSRFGLGLWILTFHIPGKQYLSQNNVQCYEGQLSWCILKTPKGRPRNLLLHHTK